MYRAVRQTTAGRVMRMMEAWSGAEKKDGTLAPGTSGLYNRISEQAPSSDCTPGIGFCMYLEITSIVLVIGSIFALPGLFSKKSSKSK